jgi:hypothetical protein
MRVLTGLATFVRVIRGDEQAHKDALPAADEFLKAVVAARSDSSQSIRGWAGFQSVLCSSADDRPHIIDQLAGDSAWQPRVLSLLVAIDSQAVPYDKVRDTAARLSNDPDATVKQVASAALDFAQAVHAAATQPSTQPAAEAK